MAETPPSIVPSDPDATEVGEPPATPGRRRIGDPLRSTTGYLLVAGIPAGMLLGSLALDVGSQIQRPCSAMPESARWLTLITAVFGLVVAPLGARAVAALHGTPRFAPARRGALLFDLGVLLAIASWLTHPRDTCVATGPWSMAASTLALLTMAVSAVMIAAPGAGGTPQ